jgi:hypothetical protein
MAALPRLAISKCRFVVELFALLIFATTFLPEEEDEETLASLRTPAMPLCDLPSVAFFTSFTALAEPFDEEDDFFESDDIPLDDVDAEAFPEDSTGPLRRSKPSKAARFVEARRIIFHDEILSARVFRRFLFFLLFGNVARVKSDARSWSW